MLFHFVTCRIWITLVALWLSPVAKAMTTEVMHRFLGTRFTAKGPLVEGRNGIWYACDTDSLIRVGTNGVVETVLSFDAQIRIVPGSLARVRSGRIIGVGSGGIVQLTDDEKVVSIAKFPMEWGYSGPLVEGRDGALYGWTMTFCEDGGGLFFRLSAAGEWTVLANRDCDLLAGNLSGLTEAEDGSFYGTSTEGGAHGLGSVFRLSSDGSITTVVSFDGKNGAGPAGGVVLAPDGRLYGTTSGIDFDGERQVSWGTVFSMTLGGELKTVHAFADSFGGPSQGAYPRAPLVAAADGSLYGTTSDIDADGDDVGRGAIFRVVPGAGVSIIFLDSVPGATAWFPEPLAVGGDGWIYSLARVGRFGAGLIFRVRGSGEANELVSFPHLAGRTPRIVVQAPDGGFFVAADAGGATGAGTIQRVEADGRPGPITSFKEGAGSRPTSFVGGTDGVYYGTAAAGGAHGAGTIFRFSSQGLEHLHSFSPDIDGRTPGGLIRTRAGRLYGFTTGDLYGPTEESLSRGTVFELGIDGAVSTLVRFAADAGRGPERLVDGGDGRIYGVTSNGGTDGMGTVFAMSPGGLVTILHSFNFSDGASPSALVLHDDGHLYGIAGGGGIRFGVVFRVSLEGEFQTLSSLEGNDFSNPGIPRGAFPSDLLRTRDGNIYGVTGSQGSFGEGTFFRIGASGAVTTLGSFSRSNMLGRLIEGADGNLYGINSKAELIRLIPRIRLQIRPTGGGVVLAWPIESEGYSAQYADRLDPPDWQTAGSSHRAFGFHVLTNTFSTSSRFFRLVRPD